MVKILDKLLSPFLPKEGFYDQKPNPKVDTTQPQNSMLVHHGGGRMNPIMVEPFDGEKGLDNMGPAKDYLIDHTSIAVRSRQAYLESELARTLIDRFIVWTCGNGLKLQAEPKTSVLRSEGVVFNEEEFVQTAENYWALFAESHEADWSKENTLHSLFNIASKTALISGDSLIVGRTLDDRLSFQVIDGQYIQNPFGVTNNTRLKNNSIIDNGIEIDAKGRHIAYHVLNSTRDGTNRIEAYGRSTGMRFAWLLPGIKHKISDNRGIPVLSSSLEALKKLDRYKEATVSGAEEVAKVAYQILHDQGSGEANPFASKLTATLDVDNAGTGEVKQSYEGADLEQKVYSQTERAAVNMPEGARLEGLNQPNGQTQFKDFYNGVFQGVAASVGIPVEVAMMMYNSNFSASRAALKDWEHSKEIWSDHFAEYFYKPAYRLFFSLKVAQAKIQAPGYLEALAQNNKDVLEAYRATRWVGKTVPHVDPVKEVQAARKMLGSRADHLPLSTLRKVTEKLNLGESEENIRRFAEELSQAEEEDIPATEPQNPAPDQTGNAEEL